MQESWITLSGRNAHFPHYIERTEVSKLSCILFMYLFAERIIDWINLQTFADLVMKFVSVVLL